MTEGKRELGVIESVQYETCWVYLRFNGSGQGFGGLCLDANLGKDYIKDLCATFGVRRLEDLKGLKCYALRPFGYNNDYIEGLETMGGKRFTHTDWRRKHFPDHKTRLEEERQRLMGIIASAERRAEEARRDLKSLASRYTEWSSGS